MSNIDFSQAVTAEAKVVAARSALVAALAEIRWKAETGGVTLPDGTALPTDEVSARKLTSAVTSLQNGMVTAPVAWKFPGGWQDLTQAQVEAAAAAVAQHVQACFSAERAVHQQVASLSDAEVAGFDVATAFDAAMSGGGSV
jgi:hypothetical protein